MPDPINPDTVVAEGDAAALLRGNLSNLDRPQVSSERADELDKLFSETPDIQNASPSDNNGVPVPPPEGTPADSRSSASAAITSATSAAVTAVTSAATTSATSAAVSSATRGLLDDVLAKDELPAKPEDKLATELGDVKLRSDASPKTQESFDKVKEIAKSHVNAAQAEVTRLTTVNADLANKIEEFQRSAGQLPPEAASELKELREFRALHDVSSRPEFREKFDAKVAANLNAVYDLFKQEGIPDATLASIKAMSDDARADFIEKSVLSNLTAGQRRFVEAKILDNVNILGEKGKAIDAAKIDADKTIAELRAAPEKEKQAMVTRLAGHIRPLLMRLPYFHTKEVPATATDAQKKEIEAHNTQALGLQEILRTTITRDTPENRAEALLAVPIARYLHSQLKTATTRAETAEAELKKIEAASATGRRLGQSAAAAAAAVPSKPSINTDSSSELDRLFHATTAAQ